MQRETIIEIEDIPNIGPAVARRLRLLGIEQAADLCGRDPYVLYADICRLKGRQEDPCLLDVFISAVRFMEGAEALPWYHYTAERKRELAARSRV
jgi:hypothetical protein